MQGRLAYATAGTGHNGQMELDEVDRRIVGALQVDGRASWRRIAEVINVPFSTVTRRGTALLAADIVKIVAMDTFTQTAIIEITTTPQRVHDVARVLASDPSSIFVYVLSAPTRIIMEQLATPESLAKTILEDIPAIEGVIEVAAAPILQYYRTLSQWSAGILTPAEVSELNKNFVHRTPVGEPLESSADLSLYAVLEQDGRMPVADISAQLGVSASGLHRRLASLVGKKIDVRAVVDPALVGLPISAFLWLKVSPKSIELVANMILESMSARYVAMPMGEHQLLIYVALESLEALRVFLTEAPWAGYVESFRSSLVVATHKRGTLPVSN